MSDAVVYHPGTGATTVVPEESLPHLRVSGWLLLSEHEQNQAAAAEADAAQPKAKATKPEEKQ